ncbi:MAG TPA: carboxypeptidase regulatory-like domain-containing protein, partial [Glaciihabitans sp.]|nr:carboxypeptidase regulatory-like domain-containing protein [Glaciihabitans sp.]
MNNGLTTTTANITNHGTLSLNSSLNFNPPQGSMRTFSNTGTTSGSGTFQAQGDIEIDNTGTFSAPLSVSSSGGSLTRVTGVPTTFDGPITVASGATLQILAFQVLVPNGDVTVNSTGTLTGQSSSTLRFNGATLTNNGTISAPTVEFNGSGAQTLTGAGAISSNTIVNSGSTVTLGSDHQLSSLVINGGGALNITSRTLSVSGGGTPITNNGTMTTTGSTVAYNGSSAQDIASSFVLNNLTINNPAGVTLSSDEQLNGALALTAGALSIGAHTLTLNGAISNGAGSLTGGGSSNITFGGAGASTTLPAVQSGLANLTINRASGISLGADLSVSGSLSLTLGDLTTGASTLIMPAGATSNGTTDVVGNVLRTGFVSGTTFSFGNPDNQITITSAPATSPTSILVNLAKSVPIGFPFAVQRNYTVSPTGGVGAFTATVRLHYLVAELNGNTETSLKLFRFNGTSWVPYAPTTPVNTTSHWVENNAVQDFSRWTLGTSAPTATDGVVTGRIVDDQGNPVEGAVVKLDGTQNRKFITDANGAYHFDDVETNGFYTVTPSRVNYIFSPTSRSFSQIGQTTDAVFSASATGQTANPLDTPEYFVRQHYLDFLGREPDEAGFNFWSDQI